MNWIKCKGQAERINLDNISLFLPANAVDLMVWRIYFTLPSSRDIVWRFDTEAERDAILKRIEKHARVHALYWGAIAS